MRGTAARRARAQAESGITPACAGNRTRAAKRGRGFRDHPRVCGEQRHGPHSRIPGPGSPPRVRETGGPGDPTGRAARITPACAGNSGWRIQKGDVMEDHPRVCGEQAGGYGHQNPVLGSPPRVRGTGFDGSNTLTVKGITPACAGNRPSMAPSENTVRDHPRVCGEQKTSGGKAVDIEGSPPRVRGTGGVHRQNPHTAGITPACAGNRTW